MKKERDYSSTKKLVLLARIVECDESKSGLDFETQNLTYSSPAVVRVPIVGRIFFISLM